MKRPHLVHDLECETREQVPPRFAIHHQMLTGEFPPEGANLVQRAAEAAAREALAAGEECVVLQAVSGAEHAFADGARPSIDPNIE